MHYTGVRDGKKEKVKKKAIVVSQDTSTLCRCTQNLKTLALLGAEKSVAKKNIGKNDKITNKGNDKYKDANSLLYKYKKSYPMFVRNLKILGEVGAVFPEKSLTKNFIGEKNGQIKGMISMMILILSYTIQQVIFNVRTNCKILGVVVPEKSLTK